MHNKKNYFFGIEPTKMHCNFTYPTNAFYLKFCKIKNSRCYEGNRKWNNIYLFITLFKNHKINLNTSY